MRSTTNHPTGLGVRVRRALGTILKSGVAAALVLAGSIAAKPIGTAEAANERALSFYNLHTHEKATIVFKRGNRYDAAGLAQINHFLRDWRRNQEVKMDPQLMDLVWEVYQRSGSRAPINVICGYRAPETNNMLRSRSRGVAQNSQHTKGKALDFFLPDVPLAKLRAIGLQMQAGGVGFYPTSGSPFVHMDTGSVRHWPRMTREQLVRVFPNGKTLHVPTDGKPLPGYEEALAAYKSRKANGGAVTLFADAAPKKGGWRLFGGRDREEVDDEADMAPAVVAAAPAAIPAAEPATLAALAPLPRRAPARPAEPDTLPFAMASAEDSVASEPLMPMPRPSPSPHVVLAAAEARDAGRGRGAIDAIAAVVGDADATTSVMAYAPADMPLPETRPTARMGDTARASVAAPFYGVALRGAAAPAPGGGDPLGHLVAADFEGDVMQLLLRNGSTRQRPYALLEKPRPFAIRTLFVAPDRAYGRGFGRTAYDGLRTDRFAGPLIQPIAMVELGGSPSARYVSR